MHIQHFLRLLIPCVLAACVAACSNPEKAKLRHVERGDAHMAKGNYRPAILEYRNALKIDARMGEARYKLAEAYVRAERRADAAKEYVNAAELLPDRVDVQLKAAAILLAARDFVRARQAGEAALKVEPRNIDAQLIVAHALAGMKDLPGAVRELEEAIQLSPEDSRPHTSMGAVRAAEGDRIKAEAAYRRAVEIDASSVAARLGLAYFYWAVNERAKAEAEMKQAVALDPKDLLANRMLAFFYLTNGRLADAEQPLLRLAESDDAKAMLTVAEHYARTRRFAEARTMYERLLERKQWRGTAVIGLASVDYTTGKREEAHRAIDEELRGSSPGADMFALKARFLLAEGQAADGEGQARKAIDADPNSALAHYVHGLTLTALGRNDAAVKAFNETLRINPQAVAADLMLARLSLAAGDPDSALRRAENVRKTHGNNLEARLAVGTALLSQRDLGRAEAEVKALKQDHPDSAAAHALSGGVRAARSDQAGAAREYDRALELDPANLQALAGRVAADLKLKRPQDARDRLARALTANPKDANLLVLAGSVETTLGDYAAAERHLRAAIDVNPGSLSAYQRLGQLYYRQQRTDDARVEFEKLASLRPDSVGPKTVVGILYDMQDRSADARRVYEEILAASSRAPVAANNLAWHYAAAGEHLDQALQLAQSAKQQLPDSHEVDDTLGWVYYKRNMPELAIPPLERAAKARPGQASYHYHLGLAYAKAGRTSEAKTALERALELNPSFAGADDARSTLASLGR